MRQETHYTCVIKFSSDIGINFFFICEVIKLKKKKGFINTCNQLKLVTFIPAQKSTKKTVGAIFVVQKMLYEKKKLKLASFSLFKSK